MHHGQIFRFFRKIPFISWRPKCSLGFKKECRQPSPYKQFYTIITIITVLFNMTLSTRSLTAAMAIPSNSTTTAEYVPYTLREIDEMFPCKVTLQDLINDLLSSSEESITSDDTNCRDENEDSDQPPINRAAVSIFGVFKNS